MALTAKANIEISLNEGVTILKSSFCTPPFKIADVTEDRKGGELQLMLMSSSPGVLDEDNYSFKIVLEKGAKLRLRTQSYQRIFQMKVGAVQNTEVRMATGSSLIFLPHPVVPHRSAIFKSLNKFFLEKDCSLLWGEVISCGRKMNGEIFQFQSYHSMTEIFQNGKLVIKENLLLQPGIANLAVIGQLEGYTHQATLIFINNGTAIEQLISVLVEQLTIEEEIAFGVTALQVNGLLVRLLGYKAEQLYSSIQKLSALIETFQPSYQKSVTYA